MSLIRSRVYEFEKSRLLKVNIYPSFFFSSFNLSFSLLLKTYVMNVFESRIIALALQERDEKRGSQIITGDRSERIRTYLLIPTVTITPYILENIYEFFVPLQKKV